MTQLWLMLACAAPLEGEHPDRDAYLAASSSSPAQALDLCQRIVEPALRGQCITEVVTEVAGDDRDLAYRACEAAPAGLWYEECWFALSDTLELGAAEAERVCGRSGRFADECRTHAVVRDLLAWSELPVEVGSEAQLASSVASEAQHRLGDPSSAARARDAVVVEVLVARLERAPLGDATCGVAEPTLCARAWYLLTDRRRVDLREACQGPLEASTLEAAGAPGFERSWEPAVRQQWDMECSRWR